MVISLVAIWGTCIPQASGENLPYAFAPQFSLTPPAPSFSNTAMTPAFSGASSASDAAAAAQAAAAGVQGQINVPQKYRSQFDQFMESRGQSPDNTQNPAPSDSDPASSYQDQDFTSASSDFESWIYGKDRLKESGNLESDDPLKPADSFEENADSYSDHSESDSLDENETAVSDDEPSRYLYIEPGKGLEYIVESHADGSYISYDPQTGEIKASGTADEAQQYLSGVGEYSMVPLAETEYRDWVKPQSFGALSY